MPADPSLALTAKQLLDVLHDGGGATVSIVDLDWRFRYVNTGFARALHMPAEAVVGHSVVTLYGEETVSFIRPFVARVLAGETVTYERKGRIHDDVAAWITVTISPWRSHDGTIQGFITTTMRVHELRVAEARLHAATNRLASHVENSPLTVLELDHNLNVLRCSPRAQGMLALDPAVLVGQALGAAFSIPNQAAPVLDALQSLQTADSGRNQVEGAFTRVDGSVAHLVWFNSVLTDQDAETRTILCLIEDVTARHRTQQLLQQQATHDPLTGLHNRTGLASALATRLQAAGAAGPTGKSCLYIDLDGFKAINDTHGHDAGDAVLVAIANRLSACVPAEALVARLGGDEFVVLLLGNTAAQADQLAEAILGAMREPVTLPGPAGTAGHVSASVGIAHMKGMMADPLALIKQADAAMYEAKRSGKGTVRTARTRADD